MATIVQMPAPRPRTARSAEARNGATILFFTGIRYMRDEEPDEDDAPLSSGMADGCADEQETALAVS